MMSIIASAVQVKGKFVGLTIVGNYVKIRCNGNTGVCFETINTSTHRISVSGTNLDGSPFEYDTKSTYEEETESDDNVLFTFDLNQ